MFVPVVDSNQNPLMPTRIKRAASWLKSGKATPFWKKGVFCVRLNVEPSSREMQEIVVGIDPGSKKEGFTVKSETHTYINVQADAVTHVSKAVEIRRNMRRARRFRNTPCRKSRKNRALGGIPPSTKARWQWKLRICNWLVKLYPIVTFVVEDIKAVTKGKRRWDVSFSPLQVGKQWFYEELQKLGHLETRQGYETKEMRDSLGLRKTGNKTAASFEAHCVDSWVLANHWVGGHTKPDNKDVLFLTSLRFHRRQLHRLQPGKGGVRGRYGSTNSLGFKRGSLVKHLERGLCYIGGFIKDRISLHSVETGKLLCQNAKPKDCKFLTYSERRWAHSSVA